MARYYFDLRIDDSLSPDDEGLDLRGTEQARLEAVASLGDLVRDMSQSNDRHNAVIVEVRDNVGPVLSVEMTVNVKRRSQYQ